MKDIEEINKIKGGLACFVAYVIFGINIVTCKDLSSSHIISPVALFCLRAIGAGAMFWILSLFTKKEKVELRDYPKIFLATFFGICLAQMTFLMASPQTTPAVCSIFGALIPIATMLIAAVAIKEPITFQKAGGVLISFAGIVMLILNSSHGEGGVVENTPQGILLLVVNVFSFATYLGFFKPLIQKYSVVTFMKWVFLFAFLMVFPFCWREVIHFDFFAMPSSYMFDMLFLIIGATFISYFLIPYGQKHIRPTIVSLFSYLQPMIAIAISIIIGMDHFTWQKAVATVIVFTGVMLVTFSKSAASIRKESARSSSDNV